MTSTAVFILLMTTVEPLGSMEPRWKTTN